MSLNPAKLLLLFLALFSVVSFAACSSDDDDDDRRSGDNDRDNDDIRDSRDDCDREKEDEGVWGSDPKDGCPATIEDLIELARADIDFFWAQQFEGDATSYEPPLKFEAYISEIETECGPALLNNAFYCGADHSIYYDLKLFEDQLKENGDFAPVLIIAHEWGHLVQSLLGILGNDDLFTIQTELQADCLAGVWASDADKREMLEEGDFEEGILALFTVGDDFDTPFFDPSAHGTPGQRIDSFKKGFERGLESCSLD